MLLVDHAYDLSQLTCMLLNVSLIMPLDVCDLSDAVSLMRPMSVTCQIVLAHAYDLWQAVSLIIPAICLFVVQELQLLGLPALTCNSKGQPDVCSILNRTYDLFRCYQGIYSTKEELENRWDCQMLFSLGTTKNIVEVWIFNRLVKFAPVLIDCLWTDESKMPDAVFVRNCDSHIYICFSFTS